MILVFFFVCIFTVVTCKSFYANQHLPLQKYQSPLPNNQPYNQPYGYYNSYGLPIFKGPPSSYKQGNQNKPQPGAQHEYDPQQQWQIAVQNDQSGIVWIRPAHYGYYPPAGNYPYQPPPNSYYPPMFDGGPYPLRETIESTTENNETSSTTTEIPSSSTEISSTSTETPSTSSTEVSSETSSTSTEVSSTIVSSTLSSTSNPITSESPSSSASTNSTYSTTTEISSSSSISTSSQSSSTIESTTSSSNVTSSPNSSNENPLLKYCKKPRGQFSSNDCRKFVNCWDGYAVEQSCPGDLYFNEQYSYCDYPEKVNCSNSNATEPTSTPSSPSNSSSSSSPPTSSPCPSGYGTFRNKTNCAKFYVCVYGEPVEFDCPPGTNFNDELKVCDYIYRVDCKGTPSIPSTEPSSSTETTSQSSTSSTNSTLAPSTTPSNSTSTSEPPPNNASTISTTTEQMFTIEPQPPSVDPVPAFYNYNLKKIPESIINTGVRCYNTNTFRLTPDCSSVTLCRDGLTYIMNCGYMGYDVVSQKCVSPYSARC